MSDEVTERWSRAAERWAPRADEIDEEGADITEWLLAAAAPAGGETLLELGAGPGGVGLAAGRQTEVERVILTDIAPPMIDIARERARRFGLDNVDLQVADAAALPLPDACVHAVVSRFAFQAMGDPGAAFAEALRVLRPGGRLAFTVFPAPERNPWASLAMQALADAVGAPPPGAQRPGMFALADEPHLLSLLASAGFADVRLEHLAGERRFADFEDWWHLRRELPPGAAQAWSSLDEAGRESVERRLREQVQAYRADGALVFPSDVIAVSARRPNR